MAGNCFLARNLCCLSAESASACETVVVIKVTARAEALICLCTFKIRELFLSLWKRFYLLNSDFSKKTWLCLAGLALCSVSRWHHDTDVLAPCSSSWESGPRSWTPGRITWSGACRASWTAPPRNRPSPTCGRSSGNSAKGWVTSKCLCSLCCPRTQHQGPCQERGYVNWWQFLYLQLLTPGSDFISIKWNLHSLLFQLFKAAPALLPGLQRWQKIGVAFCTLPSATRCNHLTSPL